jgi:hypothetical protein
MSFNSNATNGLIFYSGLNYGGNALPVSHGETGELLSASGIWDAQSVSITGMQAFVYSPVNTGYAAMSYLLHTEALGTTSVTSLPSAYPGPYQLPLKYLGLDPQLATVVWLDIDAQQPGPNALASTAQVGGSATSLTTLSLPGHHGALGFVGLSEGSSVVANCRYGDYSGTDGTVAWSGSGTVVMEYTGGNIILLGTSGFPDGWTFGEPQKQADGTWRVALNASKPDVYEIAGMSYGPTSIPADGVTRCGITAQVIDSKGPAGNVMVSWSTTLGQLDAGQSISDSNGNAIVHLTSTTSGMANVTAAVPGRSRSVSVEVSEYSPPHYTISSMQADASTIPADGTVSTRISVRVVDGNNQPAPGIQVLLVTTLGILTSTVPVTDTNGMAYSYLLGNNVPGTATITAQLPGDVSYSASTTVKITDTVPAPDSIESVTASPGSISEDGSESSTLTARVVNSSGQPVSNEAVMWSTTKGSLSTSLSYTDASGNALTSLKGNNQTGTANVTASITGSSKSASVVITESTAHDFDMYCVTDAPSTTLQAGAFNPVAFYGVPGTVISVSVTGLASVKGSETVTLDGTGYGRVDIADPVAETVTVTAQNGSRQKVGTMTFADQYSYRCDGGALHKYQLTQNAPADGKTPNMIFSQYHSDRIEVSGLGTFENGQSAMTFDYEITVISVSILDTVAESVTLTEQWGRTYVGNLNFVQKQFTDHMMDI